MNHRLNTRQAAARLGLSASWLNKSRVAGTGPVYLQLGRRVAYDPADLDAWLASRRRGRAPQGGTADV